MDFFPWPGLESGRSKGSLWSREIILAINQMPLSGGQGEPLLLYSREGDRKTGQVSC